MQTITVVEDLGYGIFRTDAGTFLVDFDSDGLSQVMINQDTTTVDYLIVDDMRDADDNVVSFDVEAYEA